MPKFDTVRYAQDRPLRVNGRAKGLPLMLSLPKCELHELVEGGQAVGLGNSPLMGAIREPRELR